MPRREITSYSNPTIKALRSLREKKHRQREQRFLAEGLRLLTDARESGRVPEVLVMASKRDPHPLIDALERAVEAAGGDVIETTPDILSKITGKDNPQAVAGAFAEWDTSLDRIDRDAAPIWLVAQALRDPGNLGTMLRTADAVGAGGLILIDDCADPFGVEAVRASMGAIFTQNLAVGGLPAVAASRTGPAGRGKLARGGALSRRALREPMLRDGRQRIAGPARSLRDGVRPARDHADARAGRQPECGGGRRSARLRGARQPRRMTG